MSHPRKVIIDRKSIDLAWSEWTPWADLRAATRLKTPPPYAPTGSGLYEVAHTDSKSSCAKRVFIGGNEKGGKVWKRLEDLVGNSQGAHGPGDRIRAAILAGDEQETDLWVRWVETDEFLNVEKCLFMRYIHIHHAGPRYCRELKVDYDLRFDFPDDHVDADCP